jgi:hypothetical protein
MRRVRNAKVEVAAVDAVTAVLVVVGDVAATEVAGAVVEAEEAAVATDATGIARSGSRFSEA